MAQFAPLPNACAGSRWLEVGPAKQPLGDADDEPASFENEESEKIVVKPGTFPSSCSVSTNAQSFGHVDNDPEDSEDSLSFCLGDWGPRTHSRLSSKQSSSSMVAARSTMGHSPSVLAKAKWSNEEMSGYQILYTLGKGTFATVHAVQHRATGARLAMKTVKAGSGDQANDVMAEIGICSVVDHPYIVRLHGYSQMGRTYQLFMDLCVGGNLREYSEKHVAEIMQANPQWDSGMQSSAVVRLAFQMLSGLSHLHQHGVIHRDIKPQNYLMLNQGPGSPLKLADFGLSCRPLPGQRLHRTVGTPSYVAPEVLRGDYDSSADAWSLGVTLYRLCTNRLPFKAENTEAYQAKVKAGIINDNMKHWEPQMPRLRVLVYALLRHNPRCRASPASALADHAWLKAYCEVGC